MATDLLRRLQSSASSASPLGTLADDTADLGLCIVAPSHPWLCGWLTDALGLTPGDAVMVTLPGGVSRTERGELDPSVVRGVATACFRYGCREVLLLVLPSGMVPSDSAGLVEAFRGRGVDREAIPSADLRGYLGLLDDPQGWLPRAAAALRNAGAVPDDVLVHAGIIDPRVGSLQILDSGYARKQTVGESGDALGFGSHGPVGLAQATLQPLEQRAEIDAAHQRATQPTRHVVDLATLDRSRHEASLRSTFTDQPVGSVLAISTPAVAPGPVPLSGPPVVRGQPIPAVPAPPPLPATRARRVPAPRPPPAPSRGGGGDSVDLDARVVQVGNLRLDPELSHALRTVRDFYRANFDEGTRAQMLSAASEALDSGLGVEVGLRVVIQPVIRLGPTRYQVLNELLAVKGGLAKVPVKVALILLRALLS